ncbi:MAG: ABC transporter ATP-binding protein [Pseudolabrys sp.]|nr:ABC transporter ATP-binding protein [Pseudolabrys sp.]
MDADQDRPLTGGDAPPIIRIRGVTRRFGGTTALDSVDLDIGRGEFFCLLGASGSGKTTLLRAIAGLETLDSGHILVDGEDMTGWPAYRRPVNMMFQSYALFPHLTVEKNVAFGLQEERRPRDEIRDRVQATLDLLEMGALGGRKPHQLSGGQRQRVALARALVKRPKILLLDEPLAALDKKLRERAQAELVSLRERIGITFVVVTHDQEEAIGMASRIALMRDGKLVQIGEPRDLYDAPCSRYVADFFGAANLFAGTVAGITAGIATVDSGEAGSDLPALCDGQSATGAAVTVMVRPEHIRLSRQRPAQSSALAARVGALAFLGNSYACELTLPTGKIVRVRLSPLEFEAAGRPAQGDEAHLWWEPKVARMLSQ